MEIVCTKPGDSNFHYFETLPKNIYNQNSIRHSQPDQINPDFLEACYVLHQEQTPLARAALYLNPDLSYGGLKSASIGNFESVDNDKAAKKLIQFIKEKAKAAGAGYLIGPMNGSTWDNYRFSEDHDHPNFLLEPYHHLYYNRIFLANGFEIIGRYVSDIDKKLLHDFPDLVNNERILYKKGIRVRPINMNAFEEELKKLFPFLNEVFGNNFLYSPISWTSFLKKYLDAKKLIQSEFVLIAENTEKKIIGFVFSYRDAYNFAEKSLVLKTIARDNSPEWRGLGALLLNQIVRLAAQKEFKSIVHAFMREDGRSIKLSRHFSGQPYKTHVLYGVKL